MAAERIPLPGYVQDPKHLAMDRIAYHRRRTGPWFDSRAEVFGAVHLHRSKDGECGADGVRAAGVLVPVSSGLEPDVPGTFHCCRVADRLEDHPRGIGKDHYGSRLRQKVAGLLRDRHTGSDQVTMRVLKRPESVLRKRHRRLRARRINPRGVTALPGPFDHAPDGMRRQVTATQESLPSRHHPFFLIRMWESRERFLLCHVASSFPTPELLPGRIIRAPRRQARILGEGLLGNVSRLEGACQAEPGSAALIVDRSGPAGWSACPGTLHRPRNAATQHAGSRPPYLAGRSQARCRRVRK